MHRVIKGLEMILGDPASARRESFRAVENICVCDSPSHEEQLTQDLWTSCMKCAVSKQRPIGQTLIVIFGNEFFGGLNITLQQTREPGQLIASGTATRQVGNCTIERGNAPVSFLNLKQQLTADFVDVVRRLVNRVSPSPSR